MASSDNVKIAFGVVAAAGVVFLSYVFFRILGTKPDDHPSSRWKKQTLKSQPVVEGKVTDDASTSGIHSKQVLGKRSTTQGDLEVTVPKDELSDPDNSNQTSFIIIDQPANASLPHEEGPPSSKKSDRSSDDSSFDVVETGEEDDYQEKNHHELMLVTDNLDGSVTGDNDSSMIIVNSEPSTVEASNSSFYHSADETLPRERHELSFKGKGMSETGGPSTGCTEEEDLSESISTSDSEPTVMYSLDGALISKEPTSDLSDRSKVTTDTRASTVKDDFATGDEKGKLESETNVLALSTSEAGESISEKSPLPAVLTKEGATATETAKVSVPQTFLTSADTTRTFTVCQNSASTVSKKDIYNLVELLRTNNPSLQSTVLDCIIRVSVFTHNNKYLHEAGCGLVLSQRVQKICKEVVQGDPDAQQALEALSDALTNLSLDPMFMSQLEGSVSSLIDVLLLDFVPETVYMSILRPLTNLSTDSAFPNQCHRAIQQLYVLLDKRSESVRLQCLKVLVNLSLIRSMVPHLLSAKAPTTLRDLLDTSASSDLILRTVTLLGHVYATISQDQLSPSSLPTTEKAESPYTMYTALCGTAEVPPLRNKVYCLTRHEDEEIKKQASKLYHFITLVKK